MGRYKTAWDDDPNTYDVWEERPERDELIANGVSERRANQLIWGAEPEPREGERKEKMRTLHFNAPLPTRPSATELDEIMRDVSGQLGETWTAVRLSGYWLFYRQDGDAKTLVLQSRRRFPNALHDAVGGTMVTRIPL